MKNGNCSPMSSNLYDEKHVHHYHSGPKRKKICFDLLQLQYCSLGTLECFLDVYSLIMTREQVGQVVWYNDFKQKIQSGFRVLWVMPVVVEGEEWGKEFVLMTPDNPYMLLNDWFTFVVCSSGSFDSKLVSANRSEYGWDWERAYEFWLDWYWYCR